MKSTKKFLPYNPALKLLARKLRNNSTLSEVLLWQHLKRDQVYGYDFHRQKPIDNFIVDFFCPELMLAIEIDGKYQELIVEKDRIRQERLEEFGITFLRFTDLEVKKDMNNVLRAIENWTEENRTREAGP